MTFTLNVVWNTWSGQIRIFHQPRFPGNKGSNFPSPATFWGEVVWGGYNLTRSRRSSWKNKHVSKNFAKHAFGEKKIIRHNLWEIPYFKREKIITWCPSIPASQHHQDQHHHYPLPKEYSFISPFVHVFVDIRGLAAFVVFSCVLQTKCI